MNFQIIEFSNSEFIKLWLTASAFIFIFFSLVCLGLFLVFRMVDIDFNEAE